MHLLIFNAFTDTNIEKSTGFAYAFFGSYLCLALQRSLHTRFCPTDLKLSNNQYSVACTLWTAGVLFWSYYKYRGYIAWPWDAQAEIAEAAFSMESAHPVFVNRCFRAGPCCICWSSAALETPQTLGLSFRRAAFSRSVKECRCSLTREQFRPVTGPVAQSESEWHRWNCSHCEWLLKSTDVVFMSSTSSEYLLHSGFHDRHHQERKEGRKRFWKLKRKRSCWSNIYCVNCIFVCILNV